MFENLVEKIGSEMEVTPKSNEKLIFDRLIYLFILNLFILFYLHTNNHDILFIIQIVITILSLLINSAKYFASKKIKMISVDITNANLNKAEKLKMFKKIADPLKKEVDAGAVIRISISPDSNKTSVIYTP